MGSHDEPTNRIIEYRAYCDGKLVEEKLAVTVPADLMFTEYGVFGVTRKEEKEFESFFLPPFTLLVWRRLDSPELKTDGKELWEHEIFAIDGNTAKIITPEPPEACFEGLKASARSGIAHISNGFAGVLIAPGKFLRLNSVRKVVDGSNK